jgi:hypothetical protein
MRTLTTLAILAATTATAAASPRDLPQNRQPQTEARYQQRNLLAEVGLDCERDRAVVQLPETARPLDYLELRAGRTPFALRDVAVQFADGSVIHTGSRGVVEPFEGRVIDLPRGSAPVVAVLPAYQSMGTSARLEVFGVPEHYVRSW